MSLPKKNSDFREVFREKRCCVVMPTYNNAAFIEKLLNEVLEICSDVIVVNDGCTDHTSEILSGFEKVNTITFPYNRGKGHALKAGFNMALDRGFHYAITLDSDSQHTPADIPLFLEYLDGRDDTLVIGSRQLKQEHVPAKNRFANWLSNICFRVETGLKMKDTQSGFRLYPLVGLKGIRIISGRYGFEQEVMVKAFWKGINITQVPIHVYYPPQGERISHFNPFTDFLRFSLLNTMLIFLALLYYRPRLIIRKYRKKSIKQIFYEDIVKSNTPSYMIALSIGFGIFMGIFPVWGYQLVIGFVLAHLFKLNKAIFFIAANISIPPMIPLVLYFSYVTGSYVLGEGSWKVDIALNLQSIGMNLKQYLTGAVVFAAIAGVAFSLLSYALLVLFKRTK